MKDMIVSPLVAAENSSAFLPDTGPLLRLPRAPRHQRPPQFYDNFESRALIYDAFWHADGRRILLVGPPPMNLWPEFRSANFVASPGNVVLEARYYDSVSTMTTELSGAPEGTSEIVMTLAGEEYLLPIQPSGNADLAGCRVLFTMSKDNDLAWIRQWAHYHAKVQGADAVVLFDNGSTRYGTDEIIATLLGVPGLKKLVVASWPYRYGMPDPNVRNNPFYTQFLQVSAMSVVLRRYGAEAEGLLNCDIDELVATPSGTTIFEAARESRRGLVVMSGQYIEAIHRPGATPGELVHADFEMRLADARARVSRPRKWALDPTRDWVSHLDVHPYMHWIEGRPFFGKTQSEEMFYWHFRGINTNWKDARTNAGHLEIGDLELDEQLKAALAGLAR